MGDRHGGRFALRGRALSPPRRGFPTSRGGFPTSRRGFPTSRGGFPTSRGGFPMPRGGGQDLPRARTLPTAKASRHGARAKGFVPREKALLGEGFPTRRTGERICAAQEHAPRRRPTDMAHERKDLPRARTLPTAKASRHGARAKGFVPRKNTPHGEGLPTRHTGERICPAQEHAPRRRPTDTAHERKDLPRARTLPTAKASRHGAKAKGFAPRGFALAPRADERRAALNRRTARKTPLRRGRTHSARPLPSSFTEKK